MKLLTCLVAATVLAGVPSAAGAATSPYAYTPCGGVAHAARMAAGLPPVFDRIARRESQCRPTAYNRRSGAAGLWQEMPVIRAWCARRIGRGDWANPWWNARCARALLAVQGMGAWR